MSTQDKHEMDELFKSSLGAEKAVPPPSVWEGVENALEEKKKKRGVVLWRISTIAAIFVIGILAFIGGFNLGMNKTANQTADKHQSNPAEHITPSTESSTKDVQNEVQGNPKSLDNHSEEKTNLPHDENESVIDKKTPAPNQDGSGTIRGQNGNTFSNQKNENHENAYILASENNAASGDERESADESALKGQSDIVSIPTLLANIPIKEAKTFPKEIPNEFPSEDWDGFEPKNKKKLLVGAHYEPFLANTSMRNYSKSVSQLGNAQSSNVYNQNAGIKTGVSVNEKIEFFAGLNYNSQVATVSDQVYKLSNVYVPDETYNAFAVNPAGNSNEPTDVTNVNEFLGVQTDELTTYHYSEEEASTTKALYSGLTSSSAIPVESADAEIEQTTFTTKLRYTSVEIPLVMRYYVVSGNKLKAYVSPGVSTYLMSFINRSTQINGVQYDPTNDRQSFMRYNLRMGVGLGYQTNSNLSLHMEPIFRFGLSTKSNVITRGSSYHVGINAGLTWQL